ncbi:hypothetical protein L596_026658 [Steinernema carpocapsae]|uniref:Uncharacterized protein n=1 Tax=Steinernema carpocapsae TaxID=34508 RepID=A0A4U5M203_STECR|nr:hypothetical protein L596_026658 [Steinernema carpocapsae]
MILQVIYCCTFVVYVALVLFVVYKQSQQGKLSNFKREMNILVYAGIHFVLDISLVTVFHYIPLPKHKLTSFFLLMGYVINNLALPTILYLFINRYVRKLREKVGMIVAFRNLRQDFFRCITNRISTSTSSRIFGVKNTYMVRRSSTRS